MRKITWLIGLSLMLFRPASGQDQVPQGCIRINCFPILFRKWKVSFLFASFTFPGG